MKREGLNKPFEEGKQTSKEKSIDEVWGGHYLADGYFDEKGNLIEDFLRRDKVEKLAKEMIENAKPQLTSHQLRRFFQHCRSIENRLLQGAEWEEVKSNFLILDAAAADAFGKSERKIPKIFHDFISRNISKVKTKKDFMEGFMKHFEALVGYASCYIKDRR